MNVRGARKKIAFKVIVARCENQDSLRITLNASTIVVTFVGTLVSFPSPNVDFLLTEPPKNYHATLNPGGRGDREDQGVTLQLKLKLETFRQVFQLNVSTIAIVVTFVGTLVSFPFPNVDFLLTEPPKNYHATLNPGEGGTGRTKESRSS